VEPVEASELPSALLEALGARAIFTGKTSTRYFVELESPDVVGGLRPDISGISRVPPGQVVITARADERAYDFNSRYFAPGIGVPEDPVTGSAHCALLPSIGVRGWARLSS
jgi:predicted PhzF superfamily epimerase YddE/YHI9